MPVAMTSSSPQPQPSAEASEVDPKQILAASAPWLGALLNLVPGLGTGYIYQRRWRAYWITSAIATSWFVLGAVLGEEAGSPAEQQNQLIGLGGLLVLAGVTVVEAFLRARKARMD
jgi:hypothetical protein